MTSANGNPPEPEATATRGAHGRRPARNGRAVVLPNAPAHRRPPTGRPKARPGSHPTAPPAHPIAAVEKPEGDADELGTLQADAAPADDEPGEPRTGGMFRSLRVRNYRLYAAGQVVSNTGTWMQRIAQDWLVLELAHGSGTALGITTGLQFLPMLLFGLWGGVIADRYPKRRVLMLTQVSMGVLALILGLLAVTGSAQVWHVYVLAFGLGLATVLDNPARQSFVVEMVGKRDLPNAIALNSATFNGARLVGPALAGVLIALIGTGPVFLVNAASFGAVLFGLYAMRTDELHPATPVKRGKGQLREGLRYVRGRRDLMLIMILIGFLATFGMNFPTTVALVAKEVFHTDASAFGLASSMLALGALTGALLAARRVARPRLRLLVGVGLVFGALEVVTGLMPTYWSFLALLVPTGVAMMSIMTAANSSIQLGVAPEMRGRVMGLYMFVFLGTNPLGAPTVGWVGEHFGARTSIVAGGLISVLAALAVGAVAARDHPALARFRRRPRAPARASGAGSA